MASLSGGQAARAGLLSLLASRFDIVLLDEPTNDLDLAGLERLERFVTELRSGAVIVSHDREFLARTVTSVIELDLAQQKVRQVDGGYAAYLDERAVERRHEREAYDEYADRREALARAGPDAAGLDGEGRAQRPPQGHRQRQVRRATSAARRRRSRRRRRARPQRLIERLDEVVEPRKEWQLRMEIASAPRSGAVTAVANGAVVRRGDFVLGPVDLQINWADRVAITGPNGAGKTTLLQLLLGRLEPDAGHRRARPGRHRRRGRSGPRAARHRRCRWSGRSAPSCPHSTTPRSAPCWPSSGCGPTTSTGRASTLSPGERTRAALALLQARGVNLLVLDEPTNHLDVAAIEQLESALESFSGTVLLVTHDRQMLATVRTNPPPRGRGRPGQGAIGRSSRSGSGPAGSRCRHHRRDRPAGALR